MSATSHKTEKSIPVEQTALTQEPILPDQSELEAFIKKGKKAFHEGGGEEKDWSRFEGVIRREAGQLPRSRVKGAIFND